MDLLEQLAAVHSPSGEEFRMKEFLMNYIRKHGKEWKRKPRVVAGEELQDVTVLVFGKPRTAIFAHIDTTGFTVRYQDQLVPIGSPEVESGMKLRGEDSLGPVECRLKVDEGQLYYEFGRGIDTGTSLTFSPNFRLTKEYVESPYLDNRLGVYSALRVAETLEDGVIVFSTYEEHGGGSVPFVLNYLMKRYPVKQVLISDITWVTEGVEHGKGVVISQRDRNIPRRLFLDRIFAAASASGIPFQVEVEGGGSSDGREVQMSPYAIDWCFVGAPESNVHSPNEKVSLHDVKSMIDMYQYLMKAL